MYDVILQQEAIEDMLAAYNWYEEQRIGLGDELMNEIYDCLNDMEQHPENYTYLNAWYRRIKIHRFPYFFLYEIRGNSVIIYQLYHAKENITRR